MILSIIGKPVKNVKQRSNTIRLASSNDHLGWNRVRTETWRPVGRRLQMYRQKVMFGGVAGFVCSAFCCTCRKSGQGWFKIELIPYHSRPGERQLLVLLHGSMVPGLTSLPLPRAFSHGGKIATLILAIVILLWPKRRGRKDGTSKLCPFCDKGKTFPGNPYLIFMFCFEVLGIELGGCYH